MRVFIASPLSGDFARNSRYARFCCLDALARGEAPLAVHLLYPQMLDDQSNTDRELGMQAGVAWLAVAEMLAVYQDLGISLGMHAEITHATGKLKISVQYRNLSKTMFHQFNTGYEPANTKGF